MHIKIIILWQKTRIKVATRAIVVATRVVTKVATHPIVASPLWTLKSKETSPAKADVPLMSKVLRMNGIPKRPARQVAKAGSLPVATVQITREAIKGTGEVTREATVSSGH